MKINKYLTLILCIMCLGCIYGCKNDNSGINTGSGIKTNTKSSANASANVGTDKETGGTKHKVIYINLDGFAWHYYEEANKPGNPGTPVLNGILNEGVLFKNAWTGIPAITNPMQAAIASGAWPVITGNCNVYYNKSEKKVIATKRENKAETIAEAAVRQGLRIASVHQFAFEDRGTKIGDETKAYISTGDNPYYAKRFNAASDVIQGIETGSGKYAIKISKIPDFLAIYADDLDAAGHNSNKVYGLKVVGTEKERMEQIIDRLFEMDAKLGDFVNVCKSSGEYDNMTFILTTDHGMTPYGAQGDEGENALMESYAESKLFEMTDKIRGLGYKVEILGEGDTPESDTDIVLLSTHLTVQLSFTGEYAKNEIDNIINAVSHLYFIGKIMEKEEMLAYGLPEGFADILICSKQPYHLRNSDSKYTSRGNHDSLDESSLHIFSAMWGSGIKKGIVSEKMIYNIDFTRTMADLLGIEGPKNATGNSLREYFED